MAASDNLSPGQFRFRRVDYEDEGSPKHDFVLEHGSKKVIGGYTAPQKGKPGVIFGLHSTPGASRHVPAVIGAIINHSQQNYGEVPHISSDLSHHSAPLANKLVNKGVTKLADDFDPSAGLSNVGYKEAKQTIKKIVGMTNQGVGDVHELTAKHEHEGHQAVRALFKKQR